MSAKENKALENRLYEEYNKGKTAVLAVIDELYALDTIQHTSTGQRARRVDETVPKQHYIARSRTMALDRAYACNTLRV